MSFVAVATERTVLYSQIGLCLVDEFTGDLARHPVTTLLSHQDCAGNWQPLFVKPTPTPSGPTVPCTGSRGDFAARLRLASSNLPQDDLQP
jgi:hypothetical protein